MKPPNSARISGAPTYEVFEPGQWSYPLTSQTSCGCQSFVKASMSIVSNASNPRRTISTFLSTGDATRRRRLPPNVTPRRPAPKLRRRALLAQLVEHFHGKEGVIGSSPMEGSRAVLEGLRPEARARRDDQADR